MLSKIGTTANENHGKSPNLFLFSCKGLTKALTETKTSRQMEQLSKRQAENIYHQQLWVHLDDEQKVQLQLFQRCLCMPFREFHTALENLLKRKIHLMEFGELNKLTDEYLRHYPQPEWNHVQTQLEKAKLQRS